MEIEIKNGRITIIGATREELKAFNEFVCETVVPEKTKNDESVRVAEIKTTEMSEQRSKGKKPPKEDGYLSVAEFAKKYDRSTSTIHFHLEKGLPHKKINNFTYINEEGGKAYLDAHTNPIAQSVMKKRHQLSDYASWKKKIESQIVGKRTFDNAKEKSDYINTVLEKVYYKMRSVYTVVWEQEKRDFYREKGSMPASTLRLCYWVQYEKANDGAYKGLFEGILTNILQEVAV